MWYQTAIANHNFVLKVFNTAFIMPRFWKTVYFHQFLLGYINLGYPVNLGKEAYTLLVLKYVTQLRIISTIAKIIRNRRLNMVILL